MQLTPREKDKLLIFTAGLLAERRKAKGLKVELPGSGGLYQCCHFGRRARRQDGGGVDGIRAHLIKPG